MGRGLDEDQAKPAARGSRLLRTIKSEKEAKREGTSLVQERASLEPRGNDKKLAEELLDQITREDVLGIINNNLSSLQIDRMSHYQHLGGSKISGNEMLRLLGTETAEQREKRETFAEMSVLQKYLAEEGDEKSAQKILMLEKLLLSSWSQRGIFQGPSLEIYKNNDVLFDDFYYMQKALSEVEQARHGLASDKSYRKSELERLSKKAKTILFQELEERVIFLIEDA